MAEILLFHHAHGLTDGLRAFAERLRASGHTVACPDMYAGKVFEDLDEGVAFAQGIGHGKVQTMAWAAADANPRADVMVGFSFGAYPAQLLAQELPRVRGCILMGGAMPPEAIGGEWRSDVALDVHAADPDEWVEAEEIQELMDAAPRARLFTYPGLGHMFIDPSSPDYDADRAEAFEERVLSWLEHIDAGQHAHA